MTRSYIKHADRHRLTEELELRLLIDGIYHQYGYDFREYALTWLRRRVRQCVREANLKTISGFQEKVLHDPAYLERFILAMSMDVTAMFRISDFYPAFRQKIVPALRDLPFIRVWSAGCSTGEEVYSVAIMLLEQGLYDLSRIYATDFNGVVLQKAKVGVFSLLDLAAYAANYQQAGGACDFSSYFTIEGEHAFIRPDLRKNVVFGQHNLVTDASFNEFHLILCRNVMIYFNPALRRRVHHLLYDSLAPGGVLSLGRYDNLEGTPHALDYETLDETAHLYRKMK